MSKAAEKGKEAKFDKNGCKTVDKNGRIIAKAQHHGSLFYLDCRVAEHAITQQSSDQTVLWHRRFGHLSGIVPAVTGQAYTESRLHPVC